MRERSSRLMPKLKWRTLLLWTIVLVPLQVGINIAYVSLRYSYHGGNDARSALCAFQRSFERSNATSTAIRQSQTVSKDLIDVKFHVSCDDECMVYFDGTFLGYQYSWRGDYWYNVLVEPGASHSIGIDARNNLHAGGVLLYGEIAVESRRNDSKPLIVRSGDDGWIVRFTQREWPERPKSNISVAWNTSDNEWTLPDVIGVYGGLIVQQCSESLIYQHKTGIPGWQQKIYGFPKSCSNCSWIWKGNHLTEGVRLQLVRSFIVPLQRSSSSAHDVIQGWKQNVDEMYGAIRTLESDLENAQFDASVSDLTEMRLLDIDAFAMYVDARITDFNNKLNNNREQFPTVRGEPLFHEVILHRDFFDEHFARPQQAHYSPMADYDLYSDSPISHYAVTNLGPAPLHQCEHMSVVVSQMQHMCTAVVSGVDINTHSHCNSYERESLAEPFSFKHMRIAIEGPAESRRREKHEYLEAQYRPAHMEHMRNTLLPLLESIARPATHGPERTTRGTIVAMVVNRGHIEQLFNFRCSAGAFATKHTLVIPVEADIASICEEIGFTVYHEEEIFSLKKMPSHHSAAYGDGTFAAMMWMKTIIVHVCLLFNFDVLFQDADVIWMAEPWEIFEDPKLSYYDVLFTSEMSPQIRFQPYLANSGFFYVRSTNRSKVYWEQLLLRWDQMLSSRSQQELVNDVGGQLAHLGELRFGLMFSKKMMHGWHMHRKRQEMNMIAARKLIVNVFHMNWTLNKKAKIVNWKKLRLWFVKNDTMCMVPKKGVFKSAQRFDELCCADGTDEEQWSGVDMHTDAEKHVR